MAQCIPLDPELWKVEHYRQFLDARRQLLADTVNSFLQGVSAEGASTTVDATALISSGEGESVEFKETARVNIRTGQVDKEMEKVVVKTVAAFFNAHGGTLIVGVNDAGIAVGLDRDFATLGSRPDQDGYEQYLRNLMNRMIGKDRCVYLNITFPEVNGTRVCVVHVPKADRPVYVSDGNAQSFYVRSGNTTQSFSMQDAITYSQSRFSKSILA